MAKGLHNSALENRNLQENKAINKFLKRLSYSLLEIHEKLPEFLIYSHHIFLTL